MTDREKIIEGLEMSYRYSNVDDGNTLVPQRLVLDALALLKEYDDVLKLMVYQYCTMKPPTLHDEVFHNRFMSAGEAAFRLLGLENGQSTDGVWERWFPNG